MVRSTEADAHKEARQAVSTRKQPGYGILLGLTITSTLAAVLTLLPMPASKPNALGYVSHCTWAPWSTLILLATAGALCKLRVKRFQERAPGAREPT
jgi:hypothetical protein